MIIDVHTHIFPEKLAAKAIEALSQRSGFKPYHNGTESELLEQMDKFNVDYSVVQSIATNPEHTVKVNDFAISLLKSDRFIPFGSIHPEYKDWEIELERLKTAGIKGIKLHPDYQGFYVDEKRLIPIYRKAFEMGMFILFHAGFDPYSIDDIHCTPERVYRVMEEFDGNNVIFAHMGGEALWDDVEKYMIGKNIYIDTSFAVKLMDTKQVVRMINNHGSEKVLFGTDSPWCLQGEEIERIRQLGLPEISEKNILGLNAERLLFYG